ncbi:hypothetical protein IL54_0329 [Sphingobium sp. ba1]|nr:hypothetical protein IL54_0329 [Sphingobium sp. ba1]
MEKVMGLNWLVPAGPSPFSSSQATSQACYGRPATLPQMSGA